MLGVISPNKIRVLLIERANVARMLSVTTCLTYDMGIHNLVSLLVWRLQPFHEKIHLSSKHIDTIDLVNSLWSGWLPISFATMVGSNLVHKRLCSCNDKREEWTTCYCNNVVLRLLSETTEEILDDQPFLHVMVWACCYVFLETFPDFRHGFIRELLKAGNYIS